MTNIIHHVALIVREPKRTAAIFESLFGATVIYPGENHSGPAETIVSLRGLSLVLVKGEPPATRSDEHIAFTVRAEEIQIMASKLEFLGVQSQTSRAGSAPGLYFVDYDNHLFELNPGPKVA